MTNILAQTIVEKMLQAIKSEWDKDYSMDLIGREYCRDRQLMTTKENFDQLLFWKNHKHVVCDLRRTL